MSSGKNPLVLMMALSMPGAAQALGLGDIHVDSGLNERLSAQIDIVGATALELADLRAAVANRETFLRYGADRPAFLSSATFKVTQDSQGRPVLAVRSTESFTEPVVNFLVDLNWRNGELVRQYTLLLDPVDLAGARRAALTAPAAAASEIPATSAAATEVLDPTAPAVSEVPAPAAAVAVSEVPARPAPAKSVVEAKPLTAARSAELSSDQSAPAGAERAVRKTTHIKVGAKATLRGVAWRAGERSEADLRRMMIAIFRANPNAFDGNINRLHRGAVLTIPSRAELAAISKTEAMHEFHAQMQAWHEPARALAALSPATASAEAISEAPAAPTSTSAASPAAPSAAAAAAAASSVAPASAATLPSDAQSAAKTAPTDEALDHRIQSLEQELNEVKGLLENQHDQLLGMQRLAARLQKPASVVVAAPALATPAIAAPLPRPKAASTGLFPLAAGFGTLAAALAAIYFRFRRRTPSLRDVNAGTDLNDGANATVAGMDRAPSDAAAELTPKGVLASGQDLAGVEMSADAFSADSSDVAAASRVAAASHVAAGSSSAVAPHSTDGYPSAASSPSAGSSPSAASPPSAATLLSADAGPTAAATTGTAAPAMSGNGDDELTHPALPILSSVKRSTSADATVNLHVDTVNLRMDSMRLDYNLLDLDLTAQHVQMPSVLNEHAVVKERRTNLADVLKLAIEREPDRHDLRLKLLELYYAAAATNRQAFLEVVQQFARDRDYLQPEQWDKIAFMGRQIAAGSPLFAEGSSADDDLADCA